jgi:hypothetical protein
MIEKFKDDTHKRHFSEEGLQSIMRLYKREKNSGISNDELEKKMKRLLIKSMQIDLHLAFEDVLIS